MSLQFLLLSCLSPGYKQLIYCVKPSPFITIYLWGRLIDEGKIIPDQSPNPGFAATWPVPPSPVTDQDRSDDYLLGLKGCWVLSKKKEEEVHHMRLLFYDQDPAGRKEEDVSDQKWQ